MSNSAQNNAAGTERGLGYWMTQVVEQAEVVRHGFEADPVHDLRVAIRRCRSIGEGFVAMDPNPLWKKMRRTAKPLFAALGELRDTQVLKEWVTKLGAPGDPPSAKLLEHCSAREKELKVNAEQMLVQFDLKQWSDWTTALDERTRRLPPGGEVFRVMALQRWQQARKLQSVALRNRSKIGLHALRIGLKKFRYLIENFLPDLHEQWHKDLKSLQDLLGEIHDLDVLWETSRKIRAFESPEQKKRWMGMLQQERSVRLEKYRKRMLGRQSLWYEWRRGLPESEALHRAVQKYFETWAALHGSDKFHSRRVLRASLSVLDSLIAKNLLQEFQFDDVPLRDLLFVAAVAHGVTSNVKAKKHKQARRLLQRLEPPPGWSAAHMEIAGLAARYHRGSLPNDSHKRYRALPPEQKSAVRLLAGILRLTDSFDRSHRGMIKRIKVTHQNGRMTIRAAGYRPATPEGEVIAAAKHLLETELGIPILVSPET